MVVEFQLFRVSVIPSERFSLFAKDLTHKAKNDIVVTAIRARARGVYLNKAYRFVNIKSMSGSEPIEGSLTGRISRPDDIDVSIQDPETGDLVDSSLANFQWTHFVYLGMRTQVLAVARHVEFFSGGLQGLVEILTAMLNTAVGQTAKPYQVVVEPITSEDDFWAIVRDAETIHALSMKFVTPNVLGGEEKINQFLQAQREVHNASIVRTEIRNDDGSLHLSKDNIGGEINYISRGGGEWQLRYRDKNGLPRRRSSTENGASVMVQSEGGFPESIASLLKAIVAGIKGKLG